MIGSYQLGILIRLIRDNDLYLIQIWDFRGQLKKGEENIFDNEIVLYLYFFNLSTVSENTIFLSKVQFLLETDFCSIINCDSFSVAPFIIMDAVGV